MQEVGLIGAIKLTLAGLIFIGFSIGLGAAISVSISFLPLLFERIING